MLESPLSCRVRRTSSLTPLSGTPAQSALLRHYAVVDRTTRINILACFALGLLGLAMTVVAAVVGLSASLVFGSLMTVIGVSGAAYRWTRAR